MDRVIKNFFEPVDISIFRQKSIRQGQALVYSYHVHGVQEVISPEKKLHVIKGDVLRETPSAHQTKTTPENTYSPILKVNPIQ